MVISKKTIIFQGVRAGPTFPGGGGGGGGGPNANFYIETHSSGGDPLSPSLDPHMKTSFHFIVRIWSFIYT